MEQTTNEFEAKVKVRKWIKFEDITMKQWQEWLDMIIETDDYELREGIKRQGV